MTAGVSADAAALLEALSEPSLLVGEDGTILHANRAVGAVVGERVTGRPVCSLNSGDGSALKAYLMRCLGSRQPLVGALEVRHESGQRKLPCRGSLVMANGHRAVLLRLLPGGDERFTALTRKVDELNRELADRRKSKAILEEALRERELLLRELQHRVKNNMHMLAAMLTSAEREAESAEAKAALKDASLRFSAVSAVQQLLYNSADLESIESEALVATLLRAAVGLAPGEIATDVAVDPVVLPIEPAIPIALLLNELLTNAVKYGRTEARPQRLRVEFLEKGGRIEIAVADNGPGFTLRDCRKRASGLGLVRGLLRQLGGSIMVEQRDGARCSVSLPHPGASGRRSA